MLMRNEKPFIQKYQKRKDCWDGLQERNAPRLRRRAHPILFRVEKVAGRHGKREVREVLLPSDMTLAEVKRAAFPNLHFSETIVVPLWHDGTPIVPPSRT